jgi:hypothetical protein
MFKVEPHTRGRMTFLDEDFRRGDERPSGRHELLRASVRGTALSLWRSVRRVGHIDEWHLILP